MIIVSTSSKTKSFAFTLGDENFDNEFLRNRGDRDFATVSRHMGTGRWGLPISHVSKLCETYRLKLK